VNAFDELFSLPSSSEEFANAKDFEQKAIAKMGSFYKTLDNDRYWAQCMLNDVFTKSAQVRERGNANLLYLNN
jgi:hypothetical protein